MSKYVGKIITNQAPAGYSVAFDGTGDYLTVPDNTALEFGSSDFTIEAWFYFAGTANSTNAIVQKGGTGTSNLEYFLNVRPNSSVIEFSFSTNGTTLTTRTSSSVTIAQNTWHHVAVARTSATLYFFLNGVSAGTAALSSTLFAGNADLGIGASGTGSNIFAAGYISNLRILKGTALYTTNFTPPTQLFPITNTSLLTCQSPSIVDNSSNAFAITTNGNAAVSTFTPFVAYNPAPTSAFPLTPAPGIWTLDEAMQYTQQGVWPSPITNAIEDVFSTYLYTGADTSQTRIIQNNIALATGVSFVVYENTYGGGLNSSFVAQSGDVIIFYAVHSSGSTVTFTLNGVSQTAKTTRVDENGYWNGVYIETLTAGNNTFISSGVSLGYTSAIVVRGASSVSVATNLATTGFADSFTTTSFSTTGFGLFLISDRDPNATPTISGSYQALDAQYTYFRSRFLAISGNGSVVASQTCTGNGVEWGNYCGIKIEGMGATVPVATGYGGLVWIKSRSAATDHALYDTNRGATLDLVSNSTAAQTTQTTGLTSFNSNGFSIGSLAKLNTNAATYASWTFRKQSKFFDVVTYTGNGSATRTISHNLGSVPGFIIIKETSAVEDWCVLAGDSSGNYQYLYFNTAASSGSVAKSSVATSTTIDIAPIRANYGTNAVNESSQTYVMYLFASDAGGFGPAGTDNVISCGSFDASGGTATVTLGWEPQFVIVKPYSAAGYPWYMADNMRGLSVAGATMRINANQSAAEASMATPTFIPTPTGFNVASFAAVNIYIAIRRGPMRPPTTGTSVFFPLTVAQADTPNSSGVPFPPDLVNTFSRNGTDRTSGYDQFQFLDRLRNLGTPVTVYNGSSGNNAAQLISSSNAAENAGMNAAYVTLLADSQNITRGGGWNSASYGNWINYFWRRAPGFFDVVCYSNAGSPTTVAHNLGVEPELIITKRRNGVYDWIVYSKTLGASKILFLNLTNAETTFTCFANVGATSFQTFTPANDGTQVAYLFATVGGVSKVGSYTGTGTTQQINCGFTNGSRFVMIKRTDSTGDWYVWDSARGIVAGNDPYLLLNSTAAEVTNTDYVDTYSLGFELSSTAPAGLNANGGKYIFLAIA